MSRLDRKVLSEKASVIERHLTRVAAKLPDDPEGFLPATDASDAVILHLWQATQTAIDLAISACIHFHLGAPANYGAAFRSLAKAGVLEAALAARLVRAAGFRNMVAHAYDTLDMTRVFRTARDGPADLRAFLQALAERI